MNLCPICEQDCIYSVFIIPLGRQRAWLCGECEAFWLPEARGCPSEYERYPAFMRRHGLPGTWDQLEIISPEAEER